MKLGTVLAVASMLALSGPALADKEYLKLNISPDGTQLTALDACQFARNVDRLFALNFDPA